MKARKATKATNAWELITREFIRFHLIAVPIGSVITILRSDASALALFGYGVFSAAFFGFTFFFWRTQFSAERQGLATNPPGVAEWLVALIIPKRRSEGLLGDLEERFHRHVKTRGLRRARALYWAEVSRSILPLVSAKARKLGLIAVIAEIWRRSHS